MTDGLNFDLFLYFRKSNPIIYGYWIRIWDQNPEIESKFESQCDLFRDFTLCIILINMRDAFMHNAVYDRYHIASGQP
jgi:hypothetical protein